MNQTLNIMKKISLLFILLIVSTFIFAQTDGVTKIPEGRTHTGFYLSMGAGPHFPSISSEIKEVYDYTFTGTGAVFDIKIGGAVKENLILHATLISSSLSGPKVTSGSNSQNASNNLSIGEAMLGGGLTYYIMPQNIFFSGSVGFGGYSLIDNDNNNTSVATDRGFAMQLKAGKEWWVSKRWGLGIAVTYGKTKLTNTPGGSVEELMDSNNFGILFNATLN